MCLKQARLLLAHLTTLENLQTTQKNKYLIERAVFHALTSKQASRTVIIFAYLWHYLIILSVVPDQNVQEKSKILRNEVISRLASPRRPPLKGESLHMLLQSWVYDCSRWDATDWNSSKDQEMNPHHLCRILTSTICLVQISPTWSSWQEIPKGCTDDSYILDDTWLVPMKEDIFC